MDTETVKRPSKRHDQVTFTLAWWAANGILPLRRVQVFRIRSWTRTIRAENSPWRSWSMAFPFRVIRADAFVHELVRGAGRRRVLWLLLLTSRCRCERQCVVEARLANLGTAVGTPITLAVASDEASQLSGPGTLRWLGGLRFSGWIAGCDETAMANVLVDGTLITRVRATRGACWHLRRGCPRRTRFRLPSAGTIRRRQCSSTSAD